MIGISGGHFHFIQLIQKYIFKIKLIYIYIYLKYVIISLQTKYIFIYFNFFIKYTKNDPPGNWGHCLWENLSKLPWEPCFHCVHQKTWAQNIVPRQLGLDANSPFFQESPFFPQGKLFIEATWLGLPSSFFP
jgi:hypothetical protein